MGWMSSPFRLSVVLPTGALAIALVGGAVFLLSTNEGTSPASELCTATGSETAEEAPFLAENSAAMKKMMNDMAVKPKGNVDADFVAMMVPHHQGAIDMALAELRYGKNEQLRRIAQELIVDQQQEIVAMRLALGQSLPASEAAPTQIAPPTTPTAFAHDHPPISH